MKTINLSLSVDDESYEAAQSEATKQQKTLSALVAEFFTRFKSPASPSAPRTATPSAPAVYRELSEINPELAELLAEDESRPVTPEHKARAEALLAALGKARNTEPVGRLNREELYDRKVLR